MHLAIWQLEYAIMAHSKQSVGSVLAGAKPSNGSLGLADQGVFGVMKAVKAGLPYARLTRFAASSGLTLAEVAQVLRTPPRTLARRKAHGVLTDLESERLVRLAGLFDQAVELMEGDAPAATAWLRRPVKALGNQTPLELAATEIGARAVADLIGRLEFGVYP